MLRTGSSGAFLLSPARSRQALRLLLACLSFGLLVACELGGGASEVADPPDAGGGGGGGGGTGGAGGGAGSGGSGSGGSGGAGSGGASCELEVGTGSTDAFEPLVEGQAIDVATLGQGGQHIWGGIRVHGIDEGDVFLDYYLLSADGSELSHNPACIPLVASPLGDGYRERGGLIGFLPAGAADGFIGGADVTLRMRVRSGASALACRPPDAPSCDVTAEVRVHASWEPVDGGGGSCGAPGCR